ncbi:complement component C1q receptor [Rhinophrynus dorsalis]
MVTFPFLLLLCVFFLDATDTDVTSEVICINKACYTINLGKSSFTEAQKKCIDNGGDLVTIKDEEEAGHLYSLLSKLPNSTLDGGPLELWIGLKLKKCNVKQKLLKGFNWVTGERDTEESQFSNWMQEPASTCTGSRCVTMTLHHSSPNNYKWLDRSCSSKADGYFCKFHFTGMCKRVVLAGPGFVQYTTPFNAISSSLTLVPHGSMAEVNCKKGKPIETTIFCNPQKDNVFEWSQIGFNPRSLGPLCASPELGCKYNNGGCEHECIEESDSSLHCECKEGFVLAPDKISCILPQHCQPNPCHHSCTNHNHGFECTCYEGYALADNKINCTDIDECLENPCNQLCINTPGSFQCKCQEGFKEQSTTCIDIDECIESPCAQGCLNTHGSYHCSCNEGYFKGNDGVSCLDVDECSSSPCEMLCQNTPGAYRCSCPEGFKLSPDGISCGKDPEYQDAHNKNNITQDNQTIGIMSNGTYHPTLSSVFSGSSIDSSGMETANEIGVQSIPITPMTPETRSSPDNNSVDHLKSGKTDEQRLILLVSTMCACGVVLLILGVVGGILYHRRKDSDTENDKAPNATDNYGWHPEQSGNKAPNNEYR